MQLYARLRRKVLGFRCSAIRRKIKTRIVYDFAGFIYFIGGEGGIRTRVRLTPKHAFQACDLNRSSTSPLSWLMLATVT